MRITTILAATFITVSFIACGGGHDTIIDYEYNASSSMSSQNASSSSPTFEDLTHCKDNYVIPTDTHLSGDLPECTHLTADKAWLLEGYEAWLLEGYEALSVNVPDGHVLKIDAGTTILGEHASVLIIKQGGTLLANGTEESPITFKAKENKWGGVVIIGNGTSGSPYPYCYDVENEIIPPSDGASSGSLTHLVIKDAGTKIDYDIPSQAMCITNVSAATTIENITIDNAFPEDGLEIFGGSVNLSDIDINGTGYDGCEVTNWDGEINGMVVNRAGHAGIKINYSKSLADAKTIASFKNITIDTNASRKFGGIFVNFDAGGHFENVTIHHNAKDVQFGALHTNGLFDVNNTSFTNLIIDGTNPVKVSGDSAEEMREVAGLN